MMNLNAHELNMEELRVMNLANILKAVSHPARLCIVKKLYFEGNSNVSYFTGCMSISQSGVSQHLAKLRDLGIVEATRQGTEIYYRLVDEDVKHLVKNFFMEDENE